jgi:hypothetical protein
MCKTIYSPCSVWTRTHIVNLSAYNPCRSTRKNIKGHTHLGYRLVVSLCQNLCSSRFTLQLFMPLISLPTFFIVYQNSEVYITWAYVGMRGTRKEKETITVVLPANVLVCNHLDYSLTFWSFSDIFTLLVPQPQPHSTLYTFLVPR